ncbi:DsbA family protein [Pseudovibrio japonicus]|uniref:DsbA family protein n=1 Tax=Pseudovibrio japonicus TaxID=366534 RepID=A0ABQ3EPG7_9HYPH|nr:hypothetical protein [Pseudovibrio japonicus]GHB43602.1 DsbA family protein [Pseudovibrio japonicus]
MQDRTLHYIHDPLCGWCYAADPLVSALRLNLPKDIELKLHGGGMIRGPVALSSDLRSAIPSFAAKIAELTGQVFGEPFMDAFIKGNPERVDSYTIIRGELAVEFGTNDPLPFLKELQKQHFLNGVNICELDGLREVAALTGYSETDFDSWLANISEADVEHHVEATRTLLAKSGGSGFPTFVLESAGQMRRLDHAAYYSRPEDFSALVQQQLETAG